MLLDEAVMRMKTLCCPQCNGRKKLFLLMPDRYAEMAEERAR